MRRGRVVPPLAPWFPLFDSLPGSGDILLAQAANVKPEDTREVSRAATPKTKKDGPTLDLS